MVEITFTSKSGEKNISSDNVQRLLKNMADIVQVIDISTSVKEAGVMVFDCKLDNFVFKFDEIDKELLDEFEIDEEYLQVLFEDINGYIYDLIDDIEHDLRETYKFEKIKLGFEIYDMNENFSDIKFVMVASFKEMTRLELSDLTKIAAKRQLLGSSKYFN